MENHLSITIRNYIRHWYLLLILGIVCIGVWIWVFRTPQDSYLALSQLFTFIMLWNLLFAGMTIVFYTALSFIIVGVFQVYLSLKLRKLRNLAR